MTMPDPSDQVMTSLLAFGLLRGLVSRTDVVEWADRIIARRDQPPAWLLDLSMSAQLHLLDVVSLLNNAGAEIDPVQLCRGILSLLPDMSEDNFAELERRAEAIYLLVFDAVQGNWSYPILSEADGVRDNFEWKREGYIQMSEGQVIDQVHSFIERYRDSEVRRALAPVLFSIPKD